MSSKFFVLKEVCWNVQEVHPRCSPFTTCSVSYPFSACIWPVAAGETSVGGEGAVVISLARESQWEMFKIWAVQFT